ncbi:MAG TPA: hypothetical protein VM695_05050 [Phycisphaerae bacterium]|nr:hypothetical protein [Phycisphaerae bacterium]
MVRLVRNLLGLPFEVLGGLLGMLGVPATVSLLKAAWWLNGNGSTALKALAQLRRHLGHEAALLQAHAWLASRPRPEVAAYAGLLHLEENELGEAGACLEQGRQLGRDRDGNLELLEYLLACMGPDPAAAEQAARDMESRRDLNSTTRKLILERRLWQELVARRLDAVRDYARRLLEVSVNPQASVALWAVCRAEGHDRQAERHLLDAAMPEPQCWYFRYIAAEAVGADTEAAEALQRLREADRGLADRAEAARAFREARG